MSLEGKSHLIFGGDAGCQIVASARAVAAAMNPQPGDAPMGEETMDYIENRTFDEIKVGDSASLVRTLTKDDISIFAAMSGDVNPAHVDQDYAKSDMFHKIIAHGMWGGSLISTLLGYRPDCC